MTRQKMTRKKVTKSSDEGIVYGLIGGLLFGSVIYTLTGEVIWLGVGLLLGMVIGHIFSNRTANKKKDTNKNL